MFIEIVFIVILVGIITALFTYSQDGDINTLTQLSPKVQEIKAKYKTKDQIAQRLHNLIIYNGGYIRWPQFLIVSLFTSIIILQTLTGKVDLGYLLVLSSVIFVAIDLPNRWGQSHISSNVSQEATQLCTLHSLLKE